MLAGPVNTYNNENEETDEEESPFLKDFSIENHFGIMYFITVPLDGVEIDDEEMDLQLVGQILTHIAMQNVSLDLSGYRVEGVMYSGQEQVNWNRKKNMVITLTKIREEYYPPPIKPPPPPPPGPGPDPDPDPEPPPCPPPGPGPDPGPEPVPEPATFLLIAGGLVATAFYSRRKRGI